MLPDKPNIDNPFQKGYNLKHILLVGYSRSAEAYIDRITANPQWGYMIRGILDDHVPRGAVYKGVRVLGSVDNLLYILPESRLDEIAITLSLSDYDKLEEIVNQCEKSGVHTKFIPDYNSLIPGKPYTEDLGGLPVIVSEGAARLKEGGALAGSTLQLAVAVKNISEVTGLPLKELVKSSSLSAANALGLQGIGKIEPGYAADIVLLDDDFNCKVTMVDGEVRYDAR